MWAQPGLLCTAAGWTSTTPGKPRLSLNSQAAHHLKTRLRAMAWPALLFFTLSEMADSCTMGGGRAVSRE